MEQKIKSKALKYAFSLSLPIKFITLRRLWLLDSLTVCAMSMWRVSECFSIKLYQNLMLDCKLNNRTNPAIAYERVLCGVNIVLSFYNFSNICYNFHKLEPVKRG